MTWSLILYYVVGITGALNLIRLLIMLIATNAHDIKEQIDNNSEKLANDVKNQPRPWVSVVIPAYNEELTILPTIKSVLANKYSLFDVVIVDDGSSDKTSDVVAKFIADSDYGTKVKLVTQVNGGKASALNNALYNHCYGSLIMCLDADSMLHEDAISRTVVHFQRNPSMLAMPSNVSISGLTNMLGIAQRYEYLLSYRLKRGLSILGIEYIVGGVGSTFRKKYLKEIGGYDTNTITEDIDLTLKILANAGSKNRPIHYGFDVYSYTQGVRQINDLIKQRYRWKYGRMQAFVKHKEMFFNSDKKHSKLLTFYQLPYAIFGELVLLVEPLLVVGVFGISIMTQNYESAIIMFGFVVSYTIFTVTADTSITKKGERLKLVLLSPLAFIGFYILTYVELVALLKCIRKMSELKKSLLKKDATWDHVERYAAISSN